MEDGHAGIFSYQFIDGSLKNFFYLFDLFDVPWCLSWKSLMMLLKGYNQNQSFAAKRN